jgi:hypothetical protein
VTLFPLFFFSYYLIIFYFFLITLLYFLIFFFFFCELPAAPSSSSDGCSLMMSRRSWTGIPRSEEVDQYLLPNWTLGRPPAAKIGQPASPIWSFPQPVVVVTASPPPALSSTLYRNQSQASCCRVRRCRFTENDTRGVSVVLAVPHRRNSPREMSS